MALWLFNPPEPGAYPTTAGDLVRARLGTGDPGTIHSTPRGDPANTRRAGNCAAVPDIWQISLEGVGSGSPVDELPVRVQRWYQNINPPLAAWWDVWTSPRWVLEFGEWPEGVPLVPAESPTWYVQYFDGAGPGNGTKTWSLELTPDDVSGRAFFDCLGPNTFVSTTEPDILIQPWYP